MDRNHLELYSGLDKVPWASIETAHGFAADVPHALRDLCASDIQIRRRAYWRLDNVVVLQSDLYEAAAYLPPFLIAMLQSDTCSEKDLILDLLYEIGNGAASPDTYLRFAMTSAGDVYWYGTGDAPKLTDWCREAVRKGVEVYTVLAQHAPHEMTRAKARQLVESLDSA